MQVEARWPMRQPGRSRLVPALLLFLVVAAALLAAAPVLIGGLA